MSDQLSRDAVQGPSGPRRTSREFDEIETRALRSVARMWDGEFDDGMRRRFGADFKRCVAHVDNHEKAMATAALLAPTPQDSWVRKQGKQALRVSLVGMLLVAVQLLVNAFDHPNVTVTLPGGQTVTVTPPAITPTGVPR